MTTAEARANRPLHLKKILLHPITHMSMGLLMIVGVLGWAGFTEFTIKPQARLNYPDYATPLELTSAKSTKTLVERGLWQAVTEGRSSLEFSEIATIEELQQAKRILDGQNDVESQRRHYIEDTKDAKYEDALPAILTFGIGGAVLAISGLARSYD